MSCELDRRQQQSKLFRESKSKAGLKTRKNMKFYKVNFMSGELDWRQPGAEQQSNRLNLKCSEQQKNLSVKYTPL